MTNFLVKSLVTNILVKKAKKLVMLTGALFD